MVARYHVAMILLARTFKRLVVTVLSCCGAVLTACDDTSTSSGGPTPFAGTYEGTINVAGLGTRTLSITVAVDGRIVFDVNGGGIVCNGDVPEGLSLKGDSFDATSNGECLVGGFPCPTITLITGAISGDRVTGSGQVSVGCPLASDTFDFDFVAG